MKMRDLAPDITRQRLLIDRRLRRWERRREKQRARRRWSTCGLLSIRPLRGGVSMLLAQNLILMGIFFTIPLYLQIVQGLDALETGVRMLPASAGLFLAAIAGSAPARGSRPASCASGWSSCSSRRAAAGTIEPELDNAPFLVAMGVLGVGMGLIVSQLGNVVQSSVGDAPQRGRRPADHRAAARFLAGTALLGAIVITGLVAAFTANIACDAAVSKPISTPTPNAAERRWQLRRRREVEGAEDGRRRPRDRRCHGRELRRRAVEGAEDGLSLRRLPRPRLVLDDATTADAALRRAAVWPRPTARRSGCRSRLIMADSIQSHPGSPEQRAAAGKAARSAAAALEPREWRPAADRADPVELLEAQASSRVRRLVPLRYGRMLVSPFTFYRGAAAIMAADLAAAPRSGLEPSSAATPTSQLRRLRLSRAAPRLRPQRLRRDPAGAVGVGPEAARRQLLARRPRSWLCGRRAPAASLSRPANTARRCGGWPRWATSSPGTSSSTSTRLPRAGARSSVRSSAAAFEGRRQGTGQGQRPRLRKADRSGRREGAHRQRTAADRAGRRAGGRGGAGADVKRHPSSPFGLPRLARRRAPDHVRRLPPRRRRLQSRRRRQRRHAGVDRPDARPRRARPAVPPDQGGAAFGPGALHGARVASSCRANGSSTDSD